VCRVLDCRQRRWVAPDVVTAAVRARGDLGEATEALLPGRASSVTVGEVVETLHAIAAADRRDARSTRAGRGT
jgi:hypothetical protein